MPVPLTRHLLAAAAATLATQAAAQPAICTPVCVTCAPACAQPAKPKPPPKPCGISLVESIRAMPIPDGPRGLMLEAAASRARSARFSVGAGGVVSTDAGHVLTALRLPGGQAVSPLIGRAGEVYRAEGFYVVRYDGCLPVLMATNAADPPHLVAVAAVGPGLHWPKKDEAPAKAAAAASTPVPEPGALVLVLAGLGALGLARRINPNRSTT